MESFIINTSIDNSNQEILVIPDDCSDESVFHLVKNGLEFGKLRYSDGKNWETIDYPGIKSDEFRELTRKIEEHYA